MDGIEGVALVALDAHVDARGSFTEVFADHRDTDLAPVQWSIVRSEPGALRGMHLHHRHDELVSVVAGVLWVGLHDLRPDSPTLGRGQLLRLSGDLPTRLSFPSGVVHGWIAETHVTHLQAVSESYASYADDDNDGCRWDDPELGFAWPLAPTLISPRSAGFGSLRSLRAHGRSPADPVATGVPDGVAR